MTDTEAPQRRDTNRVFRELGLYSLYYSSRDTKLLCLQRVVRTLGYGTVSLVLASHLSNLGISETRIGLFMTLTLFGDVIISFILTMVADRLGRRVVLGAGALLMALSGLVFALSDNFYVLLLAAVVGVISPSGNEIGPFRAIEESIIAHLNGASTRSDIIAWYTLTSSAGGSVGTLTSGWVIQRLQSSGWDVIRSYRVAFAAYACIGLVKFVLVLALSSETEVKPAKKKTISTGEEQPLLAGDGNAAAAPKPKKKSWSLFDISPATTKLAIELCMIFAVDSFASGLAPVTWTTYYFYRKFHLTEGQLGTIFSIGFVLGAFPVLAASAIAKRIGNVKAMAFCHLPSGIATALMPLPPALGAAIFFLMVRSLTSQMDVAPRQAFLAAVIPAHERTAVLGIINVVKTLGQSMGPLLTGVLARRHLFWLAFVLAGSLKVVYDLSVLVVFNSYKSRETEAEPVEREAVEDAEEPGRA